MKTRWLGWDARAFKSLSAVQVYDLSYITRMCSVSLARGAGIIDCCVLSSVLGGYA